MDDDLVRGWTEPALRNAGIRRDLTAYTRTRFDRDTLIRDTEALRGFTGDALALRSPDHTMMPPEHGRRLAALYPARPLRRDPRRPCAVPCWTSPRPLPGIWGSSSGRASC
ncbi:MAG: hypothetical protein J2P34_08935 [Actinobacteria bacterium]|nr:hypothetical protein [Actinomycetota bacterium]